MIRNINRQKISENRQKWLKIGFTYPLVLPVGGVVKFISTSILTVFGIWYLMMKKHFFKSMAALAHLPRAFTWGPKTPQFTEFLYS